ncbi:hypothetical protein F9C07_1568963 [Aspergillus flavus]|uniref:Uncharacterized protein n=1 Tax=Aspergillus flavus (strain ATCC 200026 / FGSC A1120 / IAM 13836 / NRRL 3357 / JCM 12722 / SRRC 167) TaxID=332952 RepID=A0A7U2QZC4_ASPFN|nr:hypothetical protein F9C07_1568963 [Aspergillus flavus]
MPAAFFSFYYLILCVDPAPLLKFSTLDFELDAITSVRHPYDYIAQSVCKFFYCSTARGLRFPHPILAMFQYVGCFRIDYAT